VTSDLIAKARALSSVEENEALYRQWAATYDRDVFDTLGFTGSDRIADLLASYLPTRSTEVLDLGCGTGAIGVRLAALGFGRIDGVDLSPEMLDIARAKGAYHCLTAMDLTKPITPTHQYGAAISAGTFTSGHVGPSAIAEIAKLLAPGAVLAWVIASSVWASFQRALVDSGIEILHQSVEAIRTNGAPEAVMLVGRLVQVSAPLNQVTGPVDELPPRQIAPGEISCDWNRI
jgi:predicted TPR repeat methyltransferase